MIPRAIIIHHSASNRDKTTLLQLNDWHKLRWPDFKSSLGYHVGYQYFIDGKGTVYQTRKENEVGAHTLGGWNQKSVGICLAGNFENEIPSEAQIKALAGLLEKVKQNWQIPDSQVFWHGEKWATDCCGKNLIEWIKRERMKEYSVIELMIAELRKKVAELFRILDTKK